MEPLPTRLAEQLREEIGERGLILLESGRRGQGGTSVIQVIVDNERGATLDELTDLTRWISARLDEAESEIPGRYRLEVTTPGLDRPLEHLWQYRKNVGRLLKLVLNEEEGMQSTGLFHLLNATDTTLSVRPSSPLGRRQSKPTGGERTIPLERIVRATVEPQF